MSHSPIEYLRHILDETTFLGQTSQGLTQDEFTRDPTLRRAFVRSPEIIGEAVKNLPDTFRRAHPDVDWRSIAGMRDRLIHGYFDVDYPLVWNIVNTKIPQLQSQVRQILGE